MLLAVDVARDTILLAPDPSSFPRRQPVAAQHPHFVIQRRLTSLETRRLPRGQCAAPDAEGTEIDGPLHAETSGGSVRLDRVTGDIRAHSSGGGIHIHEAGGRVDADTSGGGIEATFARGNARGGTLETSGGGIQVSIDPSVGLHIDASGNSVKADLPITVRGEMSRGKLQGNLGGGGELLRLHTSGGGVRIQGL